MYICDSRLFSNQSLSSVGLEYALGQVSLRLRIARSRQSEIKKQQQANKDPNRRDRDQVRRETGVKVDPNPYFGLTDSHFEAALGASEAGVGAVSQPPEVLLALWSKEGSLKERFAGVRVPTDIGHLMNGGSVTTTANAQVLVRSFVFWTDMGLDHFIHSPTDAPDNRPILNDLTVADHERAFTKGVRQLVTQGFLERDVANDVTHELAVTATAAREFVVIPTTGFYRIALILAGAFFSFLESQLLALFNRRPSPGLTYMKWNMKAKSFKEFLDSAIRRPERKDLERWALRTKVKRGEFNEPRSNAIKFEFLVRAYAKLFPAIGDFPIPSPFTRLAGASRSKGGGAFLAMR
jgi:hypothetical protein